MAAQADPGMKLVHVTDAEPGIRRVRRGRGFGYVLPDGSPVRDAAAMQRIRSLAVPPAYEDVWISADPDGHLQATGRDARGRKQYRYHPAFRALQEGQKFDHIIAFAHALPAIRRKVDADMRRRGLPREKVLATVVRLLEITMIRIGNEDYARANKSYGLTTLSGRHVEIEGGSLRFSFTGKGGKKWRLKLSDRRIARIVRQIQELPGQRLFQYLDGNGDTHDLSSGDVNDYLSGLAGFRVTAKDFRTWTGTVLAALVLAACDPVTSQTAARRSLKSAIAKVANQLGNTVAVCRKSYVHPEVVDCYLASELVLERGHRSPAGLNPEERMVLKFLESRAG